MHEDNILGILRVAPLKSRGDVLRCSLHSLELLPSEVSRFLFPVLPRKQQVLDAMRFIGRRHFLRLDSAIHDVSDAQLFQHWPIGSVCHVPNVQSRPEEVRPQAGHGSHEALVPISIKLGYALLVLGTCRGEARPVRHVCAGASKTLPASRLPLVLREVLGVSSLMHEGKVEAGNLRRLRSLLLHQSGTQWSGRCTVTVLRLALG
mmetsp:Transcript_79001/g.189723  ORF Transcript_79001/g.189723 Transcript_79001/m.189723 type:complete len:205 (-) Transcript_79001:394-1008(-)